VQRDPEIVARRRVVGVEEERVVVVRDRFVERAVFEQQVADRRDRGSAEGVGFEGCDQLLDRTRGLAPPDRHDRALVANRGDFGPRHRNGERFAESALGGVEPPALQIEGAASKRFRRRPPRDQPTQSVEECHVGHLHVDVVSLFPEMFAPVIGLSIVGRAIERGLVGIRVHHLLDALEPGERADERPYGGGPGMVLRIEPLARALDAIVASAPAEERRKIVLTSASGPVFGQAHAEGWAQLDRLILICGHYEGVDERLRALFPVEEISLGEFVLTGGEIAAMAFLDATVRLIPGAIDAESAATESWTDGQLDHPAYTRPPTFRGVDVPAVLLSGDHAKIAEWRREQSRARATERNKRKP
jgi:tRNA (guanine37-N1)-methyltransferase